MSWYRTESGDYAFRDSDAEARASRASLRSEGWKHTGYGYYRHSSVPGIERWIDPDTGEWHESM